jgi:hypothetical protein
LSSPTRPTKRPLTWRAAAGATAMILVGTTKEYRSLPLRLVSWMAPATRCGPRNWKASGQPASTANTTAAAPIPSRARPARPGTWRGNSASMATSMAAQAIPVKASSSSPIRTWAAARAPSPAPTSSGLRRWRCRSSSTASSSSGGSTAPRVRCRWLEDWAIIAGEKPYTSPPSRAAG